MEDHDGRWYRDWQNEHHARHFDVRHTLDGRNLVRNYESLNDVRLLAERIDRSRALTLLEVGCATGEFFRYLRIRFPNVGYRGIDISQPAIARAHAKYPDGRFFVSCPAERIEATVAQVGLRGAPEIVYAKDVVHHQTRPFEFLAELLDIAAEMLIMRVRTRDVGQTVMDPERSCQYHYDGWMPYIVINLSELIDYIRRATPRCEVAALRHHTILGGQQGRFLPKECYLPETGTAETSVGVFKKTNRPGEVTVLDSPERPPRYTAGYMVWRGLRRVSRAFGSRV